MVAIITSCINPFSPFDQKPKSYFSITERINQTVNTIETLLKYPFKKIYILDNSYQFDINSLPLSFNDILVLRHFQQYQFENKGINELLLILAIVDELPDDEPVFKISGRYFPNENFSFNIKKGYDFKVKASNFYDKRGTISTRAYFVANKTIYKDFLLKCLNEVFNYPKRIVGVRSALAVIKQTLKSTITSDANTSIEFASARVLKCCKYKIEFATTMGIEGNIAGFKQLSKINE